MSPLTLLAVRLAGRHRLRSLFTITGIALSVTGVSTVAVAADQLDRSLHSSAIASPQADIVLFTGWTGGGTAAALRADPNVASLQAEGLEPTVWITGRGYKRLDLVGVSNFPRIRLSRFEIVAGAAPRRGEITMESNDDTVAPVRVGNHVSIKAGRATRYLAISGLVRTPGLPSPGLTGRATAYMRLDDLRRIFGATGVDEFRITLRHYDKRIDTAQRLGKVLARRGVPVFRVQVGRDDAARGVVDGLEGGIWVLSLAATFLSLVLVVGSVATSLAGERLTLRAMGLMGASRTTLLKAHLTTIGILALAGSATGFLLGSLIADLLVRYVASLFTLDTGQLSLPATEVGLIVLAGVALPLAAALLPVYRAATQSAPRTSSDPEARGVQNPEARSVIRFSLPADVGPVRARIGLRELKRADGRTLLAVGALTLFGVVSFSARSTISSFDAAVGQVFNANRADIFASIAQPEPAQLLRRAVRRVPGVTTVERYAQLRVTTGWGPAELIGVEPRSSVYRPRLVAGRWLAPGESGAAVISLDAATHAGLSPGGTIEIRDDLHRTGWRIVGIVADADGIRAGANALGAIIASIDDVDRFRGLPVNLTDALVIGSAQHSEPVRRALSRRIEGAMAEAGYQSAVTTSSEEASQLEGQLHLAYALLYAVSAILGAAAAATIFTTLTITVLRRRRDLESLRRLGATRRKVADVIWIQAAALGLGAWLVTLVLGIPAASVCVAQIARVLFPAPFTVSLGDVLLTLPLSLFVAALGSAVPAWRAIRVGAD